MNKSALKLDKWQKKVLECKTHLALCSGRQVGKSTIIGIKAGENAVKHRNKQIMIIAATERQAYLLFEKVLAYIHAHYKNYIKKGRANPTKSKVTLINGSVIHCLPTGDSGYGIRGFTIDELYADEAHFIKEDVWAAVTPMLATTGGTINLLSTPFGCQGYFFRCFNDPKFTSIHVSTEDVAKERPDPQGTMMMDFLKQEKQRMTKLQYQQEYMGLFVGGIMRFFDDELIDTICKLNPPRPPKTTDRFLGVDIARMGGDETTLVSLEKKNDMLYQFDLEIPEAQRLTDTTRLILHKDRQYDYTKIYIDDGGMGMGVFDPLEEDPQTKNKVVAINNARRPLHREKGKDNPIRVPLMKENLYNNLKNLMEKGEIKLFDNPSLRQSLRSIQYENQDGVLKIYGNYSHIAEAIIRAAWAVKDKTLNMWIHSL